MKLSKEVYRHLNGPLVNRLRQATSPFLMGCISDGKVVEVSVSNATCQLNVFVCLCLAVCCLPCRLCDALCDALLVSMDYLILSTALLSSLCT